MLIDLRTIARKRAERDAFGREGKAFVLLKLLRSGKNIVLVGPHASGKTALMLQAVLTADEILPIRSGGGEQYLLLDTPIATLLKGPRPAPEGSVLLVPRLFDLENQRHLPALLDRIKTWGMQLVVEADPDTWKDQARTNPRAAAFFLPFEVTGPGEEELWGIIEQHLQRTRPDAAEELSPDTARRISDAAAVISPHLPEPARSLSFVDKLLSYREEKRMVDEAEPLTPAFVTKGAVIYSGLPAFMFDHEALPDGAQLSARLGQRVWGQEEAVARVSRLFVRTLSDATPFGGAMLSLLFAGPSGVGKSALAQEMAEVFYGSRQRYFSFDMALYSSEEDIRVLLGDGGSQGEIAQAIEMEPVSVLCLEHMEHAHQRVRAAVGRALRTGYWRHGSGDGLSLEHTLVALTTSVVDRESLTEPGAAGIDDGGAWSRLYQDIGADILDSIDDVVTFRALRHYDIPKIAEKEALRLAEREGIARRNLELDISPRLIEDIAEKTWDGESGMRGLSRALEERIVVPLAVGISDGRVGEHHIVKLYPRGDKTVLESVGKLDTVEIKALRETVTMFDEDLGRDVEVTLADVLSKQEALEGLLNELEELWEEPPRLLLVDQNADRTNGMADFASFTRERLDEARKSLNELYSDINEGITTAGAQQRSGLLDRYVDMVEKLNHLEIEAGRFNRWDFQDALVWLKPMGNTGDAWMDRMWRMYAAWASRGKRAVELLYEPSNRALRDQQLLLRVRGTYSFGYLKWENGVHRLMNPAKGDPAAVKVTVQPYLNPEFFFSDIRPAFVSIDRQTALKARSPRSGRIRSVVQATEPVSGESVVLQNCLNLSDNRVLARDILAGIAAWRQTHTTAAPSMSLMRMYDELEGMVSDQFTDSRAEFSEALKGKLDRLLRARIKQLSPRRPPAAPAPEAG